MRPEIWEGYHEPICGGSKPDGIFDGHWPDCELAALLKESEVEEG